ncbi:MazG-like family protein [Clostridiisalibacter paucivorans]|uniref:MazG-like family protein n=1 Tax=Clostridiisalibacter paucivorans TaxID=408753 RepID=UPI00047C2F68|nr:MazG-like family protein [Clostridiisalibacter paucivorans]
MNLNIDITKNIKVIEWLKSELLTTIASLFELLVNGAKSSQDAILDVLANIIFVTYLLGKRLGISYEKINLHIENKIKLGIIENHKIEKWYGDLSELSNHFNRNNR